MFLISLIYLFNHFNLIRTLFTDAVDQGRRELFFHRFLTTGWFFVAKCLLLSIAGLMHFNIFFTQGRIYGGARGGPLPPLLYSPAETCPCFAPPIARRWKHF